MSHSWFEHYPAGVPHEIDYHQYSSLVDLLDGSLKQYATRTAYVGFGKETTFAEVDSTSKIVAAWLQSKGLKKGDRVAIMMPNIVQYPIVLAGVLRAGLVVVNVNPLYTPRELEHQLKDSGAKAIFTLANPRSLIKRLRGTMVRPEVLTSFCSFLSSRRFINNFRSALGLWLKWEACEYSSTCILITKSSPLSLNSQKLCVMAAFPSRMDFISVPTNTIPATYVSKNSYSNLAFLFLMLMFF